MTTSHTYLISKLPLDYQNPVLGIICGSGLSNLSGKMDEIVSIPYSEIPNFPRPTVEGHGNQILFGRLDGVVTVCLLGRFHYYEGFDMNTVVYPMRLFAMLGVNTVLITNAAGGVDPNFRVGDIMVITDHISFLSLSGTNPLRGPNLNTLGPRFPALTFAYHPSSYELVKEAAEKIGIGNYIKKGIYCGIGGPSYETPAEIKLLRMIGGGSVGMSTVPEVIAAAHCGINVVALSLITNIAIVNDEESLENKGDSIIRPTHEEVLQTSKARARDMEELVFNLAQQISKLNKL